MDLDIKISLGIIFIFAIVVTGVFLVVMIQNEKQAGIDRIDNCKHSCEAMDYKYSRVKFNPNIHLKYPDRYNCYCIYNQSIIKIW